MISLKISRYIGLLSKIKHYVSFEILKTLYNSLIMPQLLYGILAWGKNITHLTKLQKKSIRVITCSRYNEHTEPLFKTLKLLKIEDMFTLSALKFYYKHCHRLLPYYLQSFELPTRLELCPYNIRTKHCLHITKIKTKAAENSIRHSLPKIINTNSPSILQKISTHSLRKISTDSFQGFVFYIKQHLVQTYEDDCSLSNCYVCNR